MFPAKWLQHSSTAREPALKIRKPRRPTNFNEVGPNSCCDGFAVGLTFIEGVDKAALIEPAVPSDYTPSALGLQFLLCPSIVHDWRHTFSITSTRASYILAIAPPTHGVEDVKERQMKISRERGVPR